MIAVKSRTLLLCFLFALFVAKKEVVKISFESAVMKLLVNDKYLSLLISVDFGHEILNKNIVNNLIKELDRSKIQFSIAKKNELRVGLEEKLKLEIKKIDFKEKSEEMKKI